MRVYEEEFQLESERLSAGGLFRILQQVSTVHCNELGLGTEVIGPKGLIWVAVRQRIQAERWPRPGEKIIVKTWPGRERHMMFPRYYLICSAEGESLMSGCTLWSMVDAKQRRMISPAAYGLSGEGLLTGQETPMPKAPAKLPVERRVSFTVPEEYLDVNEHMNNTRYYDIAEASLAGAAEGLWLREVVTEFAAEARKGDQLSIGWGREQNRFYICGEHSGPVFRMSLEYA